MLRLGALALLLLAPLYAGSQTLSLQTINCAPNTPCSATGPFNTITGDNLPTAGYKLNTNFSAIAAQVNTNTAAVATLNGIVVPIPAGDIWCNSTGASAYPAACGSLPSGFIVSIANGGNGTATPALTAGTNVTITGTWPNYTISSTGGGGANSVVTANGFAGSVSGGGAITLSTTITGVPVGNGTSLAASGCSSSQLINGIGGCVSQTAASSAGIISLWNGSCNSSTVLGAGGTCVSNSSTYFNVQNASYNGGADPTGGSDSTVAFQDAITAACTVGGTLKIPYGTYKISSTLNGCNTSAWWMSIEGDAEYKTYINWTGATPTLAGVTITGTAGQFACSSCTGMAVGQTLTISGTYGGTGSITGYTNPTQYRVSAVGTNTFTLQTISHGALTTAAGTPTGLTYTPGQSVFYMLGWGSSTIRNVTINTGSATNIVGWDIDTDTTIASTENLTFTNDLVQGTGAGFVGWRLGLSQDGGNDYSFINWENCSVHGNLGGTVAANSIGWLVEGPNALNLNWFGGNAYSLANGFSDIGQSGHSYNGNASYAFYGWGTSSNTTDFLFDGGGQYQIYGGRFEMGQVFVDVSSYLAATQLVISGVQVAAYSGASFSGNTGVVMELTGSVNMVLEGSKFEQGTSSYTSSLITLNTNGGPVYSSLNLNNNAIDNAEPFYSIVGTGGATRVCTQGNVTKSHSGESATNLQQDGCNTFANGNTGTAPVPNLQNGYVQTWTQNGNVTWGAPTNAVLPGAQLTLIVNHDGTSTSYTTGWNATYRNAPSIAASATANARASWIFMYDGTDWQYIGGSTAFAAP